MAIYELDGQGPELPADGNYFIADTAVVIGKVRLLNSASVWFGAVLRGDNEWIEIGEGSNVQDNSTCHTDPGFPLTIGNNCTVGHNVILHGCTLEDDALVGMGSIVMNGARIRRGSVVGAGSIITEGKEYPEYSLIIGSPARVIRTLTPEQSAAMGRAAKSYATERTTIQKRAEEDRLTTADVRTRLRYLRFRSPRGRRRPFHGRRPIAHAARCHPDTDWLPPECSARAARSPCSKGSGSEFMLAPFRFSICFFGAAAFESPALFRSASLRSMGMPCFLSRSAKASSANS